MSLKKIYYVSLLVSKVHDVIYELGGGIKYVKRKNRTNKFNSNNIAEIYFTTLSHWSEKDSQNYNKRTIISLEFSSVEERRQ